MIEYKKDTPTINHADLIPINNIKLEIMAKNKIFLVSNSQINKDFKVITKKVAVAVWLDIQLDELAYRITVWKKDKTNKIIKISFISLIRKNSLIILKVKKAEIEVKKI